VPGALDRLVELLDLEPIEVNVFRGRSPNDDRQRVFGGQVAGQALVAAGRTVDPTRTVHSLHAYFLLPGDPTTPILYQVDRIRDGGSFTTRRVVAVQHGRPIFNMAASFHRNEPGVEHQSKPPVVTPPEDLPDFKERMKPFEAQLGRWYTEPRPLDMRFIDMPSIDTSRHDAPASQRLWFKADGELPDDPLLHACIVTYASDLTLLDPVLLPHQLSWYQTDVKGASLDHAMWFHRPFRADDWILYDEESPSAHGARGFARGSMYSSDGSLIVSVAQEGLVRVRRP